MTTRINGHYVVLGLFVALYMTVFSGMAFAAGNLEFLMYAGTMVLFIGLVAWMHRRVGFSMLTLWLLAAWGFVHMAGGTVNVGADDDGVALVLYSFRPFEQLPKYDQVVHTFGFFCATLAAWEALRAAVRPLGTLRPTFGPISAAVLIGLGLGALNELIEFAATEILPDTNVGGYRNTGWDLVSNTIGALAAGLLIRFRTPSGLNAEGR